MNKENVIDKLKTINYPGFSRDIVSFGMLKDVIVDEKTVTVYLNITSQNEAKKQEVVKIIKQVLSEYFVKVSIEIAIEIKKIA